MSSCSCYDLHACPHVCDFTLEILNHAQSSKESTESARVPGMTPLEAGIFPEVLPAEWHHQMRKHIEHWSPCGIHVAQLLVVNSLIVNSKLEDVA